MTILYIAVGIILVAGIGFALGLGGFEVAEEKAKIRETLNSKSTSL